MDVVTFSEAFTGQKKGGKGNGGKWKNKWNLNNYPPNPSHQLQNAPNVTSNHGAPQAQPWQYGNQNFPQAQQQGQAGNKGARICFMAWANPTSTKEEEIPRCIFSDRGTCYNAHKNISTATQAEIEMFERWKINRAAKKGDKGKGAPGAPPPAGKGAKREK